MKQNYIVCNCKQVTYSDIADAMQINKKFDDVLSTFESIQNITGCSTGCGGCHRKVLDIISQIMSGTEI